MPQKQRVICILGFMLVPLHRGRIDFRIFLITVAVFGVMLFGYLVVPIFYYRIFKKKETKLKLPFKFIDCLIFQNIS